MFSHVAASSITGMSAENFVVAEYNMDTIDNSIGNPQVSSGIE
jgi:hypothetical protein